MGGGDGARGLRCPFQVWSQIWGIYRWIIAFEIWIDFRVHET